METRYSPADQEVKVTVQSTGTALSMLIEMNARPKRKQKMLVRKLNDDLQPLGKEACEESTNTNITLKKISIFKDPEDKKEVKDTIGEVKVKKSSRCVIL